MTAAALDQLRRAFDDRWGGFGSAPKFPQPTTLGFVLRSAVRGRPDALEMLTVTLDRMADGGIYDHLGGGFARYATDAAWHVPHFEKMLYDNAQLAQLYTRAWQVTADDRYRTVAAETLDYLLREMRDPGGGFWSSQDADSEGVEGKFFTWTWDELAERVGEPVARCLGAVPEGNWEGTNVLWRPIAVDAVAADGGIDADELARAVEDGRRALLEAREERIRPGTDDKILTAWNAMAIAAFAEAGRAMGVAEYVDAAERCAAFVWHELRDGDGRLMRSWRAGVRGRPAFADDHALFASALLTLYETTFDVRWFDAARTLADDLLARFHDERTRRLLPDGDRRREPGDPAEGALRQRDPLRELGGGRGITAPRGAHGRGAIRGRRDRRAAVGSRRREPGPGCLRPRAPGAGPIPRPWSGGGDRRRSGRRGDRGLDPRGDEHPVPAQRGRGRGRTNGPRAVRPHRAAPRANTDRRTTGRLRLRAVRLPSPSDRGRRARGPAGGLTDSDRPRVSCTHAEAR